MKKRHLGLFMLALILTSCDFSFSLGSGSSSASLSNTEDSLSDQSQGSSSFSAESSDNLKWEDDFTSADLSSDWSYQEGDGTAYGITGWGNNEAEYYKKDNVSSENGNLVIAARKESSNGYSYTSGRIRTKGRISATYGRVEARISLPAVEGMWPAFWMLPESAYEDRGWPYSGEIDIMEAKGRINNSTSGALHYADNNSNHTYRYGSSAPTGGIGDFHVYGIDWSPDKISWYCDSVTFLTVTKSQWHTSAYHQDDSSPFNQPFYILINLSVGGTFDGGVLPPSGFEEAEMKVDYVRIYG